jgi:hypothetical protein
MYKHPHMLHDLHWFFVDANHPCLVLVKEGLGAMQSPGDF